MLMIEFILWPGVYNKRSLTSITLDLQDTLLQIRKGLQALPMPDHMNATH